MKEELEVSKKKAQELEEENEKLKKIIKGYEAQIKGWAFDIIGQFPEIKKQL